MSVPRNYLDFLVREIADLSAQVAFLEEKLGCSSTPGPANLPPPKPKRRKSKGKVVRLDDYRDGA